jgi:tRNA nucleotidyltransferase/poly(A) polymerase
VLAAHNLSAWLVGGCVRDAYLGIPTKDIDITVLENPAPLVNFCVKKYKAEARKFDAFGTWRVRFKNGLKIDFVTARREVYPKPAALPLVAAGTLKEDLFRRDFTANAWAVSLAQKYFGTPFDPYGAQKAVDGKYIKILHAKSFEDDPTRMFRAVRFAGRFNWKIEKETSRLLARAAERRYPELLSRARLRAELIKILEEKRAGGIFKLMEFYGLEKFFDPALRWTAAAQKALSVNARAGVLEAGAGGKFFENLELPLKDFLEINGALEILKTGLSPLKKLTKTQTEIIKLSAPRLPPAAVKPAFLTGGEIAARGFKNEQISAAQKTLRALQYAGKIKTKAAALRVLAELKNV